MSDERRETRYFGLLCFDLCGLLGVDPELAARQHPHDYDVDAALERVRRARWRSTCGEMTDERLNELERLASAATPGPWRSCHVPGNEPSAEREYGTDVLIESEHADDQCIVSRGTVFDPVYPSLEEGDKLECRADDAAFIAAARTAVPELIAEIRRMRRHALEE